ncbi:MAG: DUF2461 family protein, partial [bacterium]|nr:DUF2461 family protein [bacterium]
MSEESASNVAELIARVRAEAGEKMVPSRQSAESEARELLDRFAGSMPVEQVNDLAQILNRGSWGGAIKHNRFLPGFSVPLIEQMVADLDNFNSLTSLMWRGDDNEALATVDRILRDRSLLPGSGQSYPTVLMYLRDPERFAIWFDMLDRGLAAISDYGTSSRSDGADGYLSFCAAARRLASEHDLRPQELDAVLSASSKAEVARRVIDRQRLEAPTITRAAFEFLQDLSDNNNKDWFDDNRARYEHGLRDPLTAVLQDLADRFIVSLDPRINATVKRDAVIARINKYSSGDPYYTYLWGAFSRGKKQEDIQLYVNINAEVLHFGLYLGSAPIEAVDRLVEGFERYGEPLISRINSFIGEAVWDESEGHEIDVATVEDAIRWARGSNPHLRLVLTPEHPLVGSPELVGAIGKLFVAVHPLAAMAWGDDVDFEEVTGSDEPVRPDYTLDELVADTLLPREQLEEWIDLLQGNKRAALFYGPPGTGKTYVVEKLARYLA